MHYWGGPSAMFHHGIKALAVFGAAAPGVAAVLLALVIVAAGAAGVALTRR